MDISKYITQPGQFLLRFDDSGDAGAIVKDIQVFYDGHAVHEEVLSAVKESEIYLLNRHAQIVEDSKITLEATLEKQEGGDANIELFIKRSL